MCCGLRGAASCRWSMPAQVGLVIPWLASTCVTPTSHLCASTCTVAGTGGLAAVYASELRSTCKPQVFGLCDVHTLCSISRCSKHVLWLAWCIQLRVLQGKLRDAMPSQMLCKRSAELLAVPAAGLHACIGRPLSPPWKYPS